MIAIVEDEKELQDSLKALLESRGYDTVTAASCAQAEGIMGDRQVDMYLLDVKLPDGSGFDICRNIRKTSEVPVIFLTSCDDEESIVTGLDIGGDDYITKPFHTAELLSRISANLRRSKFNAGNIYRKGDICVDFDRYKITKCGEELNISSNEFAIVHMLIENKGKVVRRDTIFEQIWDIHGNFVEYNTLTVAMSRIKAKLGTYGAEHSQYIETIRNVGYRWID
ncbi:MAG: response regulator transcription factor [Lachnospira sp.]|nr:response regulator transcription factor [Lachnospira sp.]